VFLSAVGNISFLMIESPALIPITFVPSRPTRP
jgi:hypothetical protein